MCENDIAVRVFGPDGKFVWENTSNFCGTVVVTACDFDGDGRNEIVIYASGHKANGLFVFADSASRWPEIKPDWDKAFQTKEERQLEQLTDSSPQVRAETARNLAKTEGIDSLRTLTHLAAEDPVATVRDTAAEAVMSLGPEPEGRVEKEVRWETRQRLRRRIAKVDWTGTAQSLVWRLAEEETHLSFQLDWSSIDDASGLSAGNSLRDKVIAVETRCFFATKGR